MSFNWTDEEMLLLLHVVKEYNASTTNAGLDWETVKSKYVNITKRLQARYPKEDNGDSLEDYLKCAYPKKITKGRIISQLKN